MKCSSGFSSSTGLSSRAMKIGMARKQDGGGADQEWEDAVAAEDRKEQRSGRKAKGKHRRIDAEHETALGRRRSGVDPEFGEDEQRRRRAMEGEAQRKPHPEILGVIETERAQRRNQHGPEHCRRNAVFMGEFGGDRCGGHRRDPGHRRVEPDQGGRDAAFFEDDAEKRETEADCYANGRYGRDGCHQRRPMDFFDIARCAGSRLRHLSILRKLRERNGRFPSDR
ncbi:hypothetical protein ACVIEO_002123 [Rhizobium leguminosarum]